MKTPTGYSLLSYGEMINDNTRMGAYAQALARCVKPGDVVLDVGAGTGIFSLLACQLGAAHVFAIEPDDSIHLARVVASANGCEDRITFIQSVSSAVDLPIKANLMVSDLRGVLPLLEHHVAAMVDARNRLLVPGAIQIPASDSLWATVVEDAPRYREFAEPWSGNAHGLDMRAGLTRATSTWRRHGGKPGQVLADPQCWATLDYRTITSANVSGQVTLTATRHGIAHALLLWFDAELCAGIGFSNAPTGPELLYGQAFFPLEQPVALEAGDKVTVKLSAHLVGGHYIWIWHTRVNSGSSSALKAEFRQSTFHGVVPNAERLKRREQGFVPAASESLLVDRVCLELVDGGRSLGAIAELLVSQFPDRFASRQNALDHVADLTGNY